MEITLSCPKGLEALLADEARSLGAEPLKETVGAIQVTCDLNTTYRLCLWSRLANRVLLPLTEFRGDTADALYEGVSSIDWGRHIAPASSLVVDFGGKSDDIRNSHFGALRCKDAIVDHFTRQGLERPSVAKSQADVRVHVRLRKGRIQVSLDLSGESLHRRGYRQSVALAPLKENLAAALLMRADWPGIASRGGALIDPMCGSGTLLIEGAMMAMNIAPGLHREYWGFSGWLGHDGALWQDALAAARAQRELAMQRNWPEIRGYDASPKVIDQAEENILRAGLEKVVRVSRRDLAGLKKPSHRDTDFGLLITNPPYGERLGDESELLHLYRRLGQGMRDEFFGWEAAVFTGNPNLGKRMGLRSRRQYQLFNGTIPSKLLLFTINDEAVVNERPAGDKPANHSNNDRAPLTAGGQMFANRLRKNLKRLEKWRRKEDISCFRAYDADMPEYAVAVDCYGSAVHVSEYVAPASVSEEDATRRLREVLDACSEVFNISARDIAVKERRRQRGVAQYERIAPTGKTLEVREGQARLIVNLRDYLDTGLFLDHRPVRLDIAARAKGKRFLNLFCYTAVASVHAGLGGARSTTSVDMSHTYLRWAKQNLALNGLSEGRHMTVRGDCRKWLAECQDKYDLILLDPPTFSNSKRMDDVLDTQRDHPELIAQAMKCLSKDGLLIFSTNKRGFILEPSLEQQYRIEDRCRWSLDEDFKRRSKPIHYCWYIQHGGK
ncbi:bifunctional 23S rRNA (guanine(2069)-N(7))-methyltransferase RlmK/23S rRNA (guanine(2445)-N(2))-methyltransferase RlmL [Spongiibacter thalassae]|nr:bifunctional 23S rRNA (guanine(2069)-N(7))-methyltransferase RlmK/23S rRNA (guanine(2445)-N(2))-methyltransferase RlmL [Spongiibacter thalassae]